MNKTFEYKYYDTENEAFIAAKTGEVWGYVYFHENFTTAFVARMSNAVGVDGLTRNQSTAQVRKSNILFLWNQMLKKWSILDPDTN